MLPGTTPPIDCPLAWGTVGWDDRDEFYELGTTQDDGNVLVHVQLFRGRDMSKPLDQTVAQGQKLLCKVASNFLTIPPKGTRVLVAVPEPFGLVPGGSVIVLCDNPNPIMIGNLQPGEAGLWGALGAGRVLVKKNGAIVLYTTSDNTSSGMSVSLYVGPDKIQLGNEWGALTLDSSGWTLTTSGAGGLQVLATGDTILSGTTVSVSGTLAAIAGQLATCVGRGAVPSGVPGTSPGPTSANYGAATTPGAPGSSNVFIGP